MLQSWVDKRFGVLTKYVCLSPQIGLRASSYSPCYLGIQGPHRDGLNSAPANQLDKPVLDGEKQARTSGGRRSESVHGRDESIEMKSRKPNLRALKNKRSDITIGRP